MPWCVEREQWPVERQLEHRCPRSTEYGRCLRNIVFQAGPISVQVMIHVALKRVGKKMNAYGWLVGQLNATYKGAEL